MEPVIRIGKTTDVDDAVRNHTGMGVKTVSVSFKIPLLRVPAAQLSKLLAGGKV